MAINARKDTMPIYLVEGQFKIEADDIAQAENIVQNAVEGTRQHIETVDVNAVTDLDSDDDDLLTTNRPVD
jgi:hypothetical protein